MVCNGEPIDDATLDELLETVADRRALLPDAPSYFEILTAAALSWFADVAVDVGGLEVGMGGTWDATNVAGGAVAVVTNVSIDHVEYLGRDAERSRPRRPGSSKPDATLVLGEAEPELARDLRWRGTPSECSRGDVDFGVTRNDAALGGRVVDLYTPQRALRDVFVATARRAPGRQRRDRAHRGRSRSLGAELDAELVDDGWRWCAPRVGSRWSGTRRSSLLDGAHNLAGAHALHRRARRGVRVG